MSGIEADPGVLDGIGAELGDVGRGLSAAAGQADFGGGVGGSTPLTARALELCSLDWSTGLGELGQLTAALGALAQGTATGFRVAGG